MAAIPIVGWITAGILIAEVSDLGKIIAALSGRIAEIHHDIHLHQTYSSTYIQLDAKHSDLAAKLEKLSQQLELSGKFEGSFIEQRDFWRTIGNYYQAIKKKVCLSPKCKATSNKMCTSKCREAKNFRG